MKNFSLIKGWGQVIIYRDVGSLNVAIEATPYKQIQMEDEQQTPRTSQAPALRRICDLPKRTLHHVPGEQSFRPIDVVTNHYEVKLSRNMSRLVVYRVKITPSIPADNRSLRKALFDRIAFDLETFIGKPVISGFTIYSTEEPRGKEKSFISGEHNINVKQVKTFELAVSKSLLLTFLNNGLRNQMSKAGYSEIGKSGKYFNCREKKEIDSLFIYNGYKANFVQLESGFFLRVDSAKKVVRNETVLDFINYFYKTHDGKDREQKRTLLKAELTNKIVMTTYGKYSYYKVLDVHFKKAEDVILDGNTSMLQYYSKRYNTRVQQPGQPLLLVEGKRFQKNQGQILLFPELCLMTGIPENFDEMRRKKISESSIKNPPDKVKEIGSLMNQLKDSEEMKVLRELGIDVKPTMCKFKAKAISTPKLMLGGSNHVELGKEANFNLYNKPIFQCKHRINCTILHFKGSDINSLLGTFKTTSRNLGVDMDINVRQMEGHSEKDILKAIRGTNKNVNICLIVLPNNMKNDYKRIKYNSLMDGMLTQVVTDGTLRKKNLQSIATKVLLQIIAKRGNTLWVPKTLREVYSAMLIAFDTAKAKQGTVLAAAATINSTYSSLYTHCKVFVKAEDKFQAMVELTLSCIHAYSDRNQTPPNEVILLLNSCTGDQVSIYHELYFNRLMPRIEEVYRKMVPLTAVMVNVKNSERFFVQDGGEFRNVPAGTLISEGMVSENYDFFLISQQSNRGSTVPNHYRVIYSQSKLEEEALEELIFGQCFNYVNWTGSIKVPGVLQYAKKCAKFTAEVFEKGEVPEEMRGKPYYV